MPPAVVSASNPDRPLESIRAAPQEQRSGFDPPLIGERSLVDALSEMTMSSPSSASAGA